MWWRRSGDWDRSLSPPGFKLRPIQDKGERMVTAPEGEGWRERLSRLEVLREVSLKLVTERDLDRLLSLIVEETSRVLEAQRSTLYLLVGSHGDNEREGEPSLVSKLAQGVEEIRLSLDQRSIAGAVAASGRIINLQDAYQDPRFNPEWDKLTGFRTRSMLAAPMITPRGRVEGVVQALNKKSAERFDKDDEEMLMALCSQAAMAVDNARYLEAQRKTFQSLIRGQAAAIDARDHITAGHTWRVAAYAVEVGKALGWKEEELEVLEYSGLLHDQGKLGIPDEVLLKPASLTDWEFRLMRSHASKTKEILRDVRHLFPRRLREIPEIAAAHHEKLDGSGYPDGLRGEQIAPGARVVAVVDVFDALTAERPYKAPETPQGALEILRQEARGGRLDAQAVEALALAMGEILKVKDRIDGWIRERGIMGLASKWLPGGEIGA
jgi:HD-GYP domain-containing protein (c-di-GMP phosphodiesterase class II)